MAHASPESQQPIIDAEHVDFKAAQSSNEFTELRSTHRSFVFPMTVAFLVWYLLYVILAVYAPGFMATKAFGNVNVGIIFGLLQFVTTFTITGWYVAFANKKLDPRASGLRNDIESGRYAHKTN
ncbi:MULTISPECIES: DUF485 domain-containing protein [Rothia]|uniref:DUF485 domain-containing protein n=1 Tax=Rothia nasimurium TaxID=85336 RepID=A0A1Y1RM74_9MICC|nr:MULTISPECIES: DUF485 domain-containing protein [Rothia]ORC15531.1 hypothetical protein A7979_07315 [Rothia nasimurium]